MTLRRVDPPGADPESPVPTLAAPRCSRASGAEGIQAGGENESTFAGIRRVIERAAASLRIRKCFDDDGNSFLGFCEREYE